MNIETLEQDDITVLVLTGRLDTNTVEDLEKAFGAAFGDGRRKFVWDCAGLSYISSAGLRTILQALKKLAASQGKLALCEPSPMVQEVLEISGFRPLLTICDDRPGALAAVT